MSGYRLAQGGAQIDRSRRLGFSFDGRALEGYAGDTLASALLAGGVRTVARSFKYHRRRGIRGEGWEEPNAFVQLVRPWSEPNALATRLQLVDGLEARGMHGWPSVERDVGVLADWLHRLIPAGFYYKTFKWPVRAWPFYESWIRRAAGLGRAPESAGGPAIDRRHAHAEVLVVGAGPAGCAAVQGLVARGCSVVWVDDRETPGGSLGASALHDDVEMRAHIDALIPSIDASGLVRRLPGTVALGLYDHGHALAVQRSALASECLWIIRCERICLATGAFESGLSFENNDLPGVMLASAVRSYLHRHAVAAGQRMVLACTGSDAWQAAFDAHDAGLDVAAIVAGSPTGRPFTEIVPHEHIVAAESRGIAVVCGAPVRARGGREGLVAVEIAADRASDSSKRPVGPGLNWSGDRVRIDCDLLAVSGRWSPALQLFLQGAGRARLDAQTGALRAEPLAVTDSGRIELAGAAVGLSDSASCWRSGEAAAARLLGEPGDPAGLGAAPSPPTPQPGAAEPVMIDRSRVFVDLAGDVTQADIELGWREGYVVPELLKRYTTLGMGPDQGRSAATDGLLALAALRGESPETLSPTRARPPFAPVAFGTIAGFDPGPLVRPVRRTPLTDWHIAHGAVMFESGANWRRPGYYPLPGETFPATLERECRAVRESLAVYDSSPLGKFEIGGRDAVAFLEAVLACRVADLAEGRGRYALALREDGRIFDDGTVFRLPGDRLWLSSTAGNADAMGGWLEYCRQWLFRGRYQVWIEPVTAQWATVVLCGPRAREAMAQVAPYVSLARADFPFMRHRKMNVAGIEARVFRVSFTGELSYEINVPAAQGPVLWDAVLAAGERFGIMPIGSEANHVLRVEKGFLSLGHEVDGEVTPDDLGMAWAVHTDKPDFVGRRSLMLAREQGGARRELVGLEIDTPAAGVASAPGRAPAREAAPASGGTNEARLPFEEGALVVPVDAPSRAASSPSQGFVTASVFSHTLGRPVALALVESGRSRTGEMVHVTHAGDVSIGSDRPEAGSAVGSARPGEPVRGLRRRAARIVAPIFVDPEGGRMRG